MGPGHGNNIHNTYSMCFSTQNKYFQHIEENMNRIDVVVVTNTLLTLKTVKYTRKRKHCVVHWLFGRYWFSSNCRQQIMNALTHLLIKTLFIFTIHNCVMLNYIEWINYGVTDRSLM